ncbi:MAG: type II toxin-antitoxin system PemK/MazF family toxin [Dehalococcoidia bacterium]|nr:type II toxin-antitoxin system PemK/MazF family toxin [Dehalococcoidia bacterium]MYD29510.1 type II toxin-antitoxin system PemK/MazF family toxin [Dehalococcoidia bacterium]
MRRGELWTVAGGGDYTAKPRPVVILQDDSFDATESVTVCPLTTDPTEAPLFRIPIEPSERNGLDEPSLIMADKITTVRKSRLGEVLGSLSDEDTLRLNRAVLVFLGFASARAP